jgi:two-component system cell cycle sensor histidine kinase/response regulator CckA
MKTKIRILMVEDSAVDALLVTRDLERADYDVTSERVETESALEQALRQNAWDAVLCDYTMPQFSGKTALRIVREADADLPFIYVSGTIGEDVAVEALKAGANDYVLKTKLIRLVPALERELRDAKLRRDHRILEDGRQKLIVELTEAMQRVKQLTGIVSICAGCKKIRNERSEWQRVEVYVQEHSAAHFSHGLCPNCLPLYGLPAARLVPAVGSELNGAQVWGEGRPTEASMRESEPKYSQLLLWTLSGDVSERDRTYSQPLLWTLLGDVSEPNRAEDELYWRIAFLASQVNSSLDGVMMADCEGKVILKNHQMLQLWKIPPAMAKIVDGQELRRFMMDKLKAPQAFLEQVEYLDAHPNDVSRGEIELADGIVLDSYSSPVMGREGTQYGRIWTFRDISEQRRLEEQCIHLQKFEDLDRLAGGVAHDFNNILTGIISSVELLLLDADKSGAKAHDGLDQIFSAANKGAKLTSQLLIFGRKETMQSAPLDLNDSIRKMIMMLERIIGKDIHLECVYENDPALVMADAGMIEQVLVNLVVNARDAMPQGGLVRIITEKATLNREASLAFPEARAGTFVSMSVSDNGTGVAPEHLARIFEPFYTTKPSGKGTGLGLAMVVQIVKRHHGWIEVTSRVGSGTAFKVFLPAILPAPTTGMGPQAVRDPRGGNETISLVEDDDQARIVTRRLP